MENSTERDIAITGIGCRFPGAANPDAFWELLKTGTNAISEVPEDRWDKKLFYSAEVSSGKMNSIRGGFLEHLDLFDPVFFGITSAEADSMDPQQRLLLEVTYEALEDAGEDIKKLKGQKVGVFIGISSFDYSHIHLHHPEQMDIYSISGSAGSVAANRISYLFDFKGPSISIDTACSSSLVSLHLACQSIRSGESAIALAGGVNIILSPLVTIGFSQAQATSPDGHCKAFDAAANGMVRGEGSGIVILKPLSEAIKDGDRIYAVIKGSAINQDGQTNGLSAPNPLGQKEVLRNAYHNSGISPEQVYYIEAHGTGTILGDPIEAKAIGEVLDLKNESDKHCRIGSVKTNIGHLEASAGIAGLIKTALCLRKGFLVPSLHFNNPNPYIPFAELGLRVQTKLEHLPAGKIFAGVSSFGFGGTNAHVVLESYQEEKNSIKTELPFIAVISAHTEAGVQELAGSYYDFLPAEEISLTDFCYTSCLRRTHYNFRSSVIFNNLQQLSEQLKDIQSDNKKVNFAPRKRPKLAFVFSGMGSQQPGMGKELLKILVFREIIEKCDQLMSKYFDWSLLEEMESGDHKAQQRIERVQPVLFALQIGLAEIWKSWGIHPDAVTGSSVGEVAAAYTAGIYSLEDAVKIICFRNKAMHKMLGKGGLAIVQLSEKLLQQEIKDFENIWISVLNSPDMTAVSGSFSDLEEMLKKFEAKGIFSRLIKGTEAPSHCRLMEPIRDGILEDLADLNPQEAKITMFSTVTARQADSRTMAAEYWWKNVGQQIQFYPTICEMEKNNAYHYLEISPHPVMTSFIADCTRETGRNPGILYSLRKDKPEREQLLETLGLLYQSGFPVKFESLFTGNENCISLPSYPWQRESHWLDSSKYNKAGIQFSLNDRLVRGKTTTLKPTNNYLDRNVLIASEPTQRRELITNYLKNQVARVLKVLPAEIDINYPLKNLGIGSLMGMELFNRLKSDLQITLAISKFLKGPSISEIVSEIITAVTEEQFSSKIPIRPDNIRIPLSFPQQRLWFIEQFETNIFAYNVPAALIFSGKPNIEILEDCLNKITARHEILRTVFNQESGSPAQVVLQEMKTDLKFKDLSGITLTDLNELMVKDSSLKFNLRFGPLFRVNVYKVAEDKFIVLLTIHHLIADGLSLKVIFSEIKTLYENQSPETLKIQYSDYALWQHEQFNNGSFSRQLEYWKIKLDNLPSLLNLPYDQPRPPVQSFKGAQKYFIFPENILAEIEAICKKEGVTIFVFLLSVFKIMLYKYSGQDDIVIGTPVAGRNEPELENMIGLFLNMLALRTRINPEISFSELLADVSKTTLDAYDNQDIPFEKIVEIIKPERSMAHTPVFQIIMALHASVELNDINGIDVDNFDIDMGTAKFDLALSFIPGKEGLKGTFEYNTDLFNHSTIENMEKHFFNIIEAVIRNQSVKLLEINLLNNFEIDYLLKNYCQGQIKNISKTNVVYLFEEQVSLNPDLTAVEDYQQRLSYKQLNDYSNKLAGALKKNGVKSGSLIAVFAQRSAELIIAMLAILKSGSAYLPIDPGYPIARNFEILSDAKPAFILTTSEFSSLLAEIDIPKVIIENEINDEIDSNNTDIAITSENPAYVIYTSGSTGKPKGVEISHGNLMNLVYWHKETYNITTNDRSTQISSPGFDAAGWEIWPYLTSGASLYIPESDIITSPSRFISWLQEKEITISFIVTPILEMLLDESWPSGMALKKVLTGGDKLTKNPSINLPFKLFNHYGPTECTVVTTSTLIEPDSKEIPLIGKPIYNTETYILDQDLKLLPPGVPGELYIGGAGLSAGYYNHPEITGKYFMKNPFSKGCLYQTGDRARFLYNGNIEFIGRNDSQVKIRGFRIELAEIREAIYLYPGVREVAVTVFDNGKGKRLNAFVVTDEKDGLNSFLKEKLPEPILPFLVFMDSLPLTPNGKIDYAALPEPGTFSNPENYSEPDTYLEKELAEIWKSVLKVEKVGSGDNFFELGGHSLLAVQLVEKLSKKFNYQLSLRQLFKTPDIRTIANLIENDGEQGGATPCYWPEAHAEPEKQYQPFSLTDVQQAYWIGRNAGFQLGNIAAHAYLEIDVKNLDTNRFNTALQTVIDRHPMLRTVILADGRQKVLETVPKYHIEITDLINSDTGIEVKKIREKLSHQVLDYQKWPLFDISLSLINTETTKIHISIDGLIADALSMMILSSEITRYYINPQVYLPKPEISFRDYLQAEEKLKSSRLFENSKRYWLERLDSLPAAPQLPFAKEPSEITDPQFSRLSNTLSRLQWKNIKEKAAKTGVTPSAVLLTAFSKVLGFWCKSPQFTINLTLFNRLPLHPQVMQIVGDFTSLNLLEVDVSEQSFTELVKKIQEQLWKDIDYRYVGGIWVLRELSKLRSAESAAMPVVFTSLLAEQGSQSRNEFIGEITYSITQTPQVWLDHQVTEADGELVFNWDYQKELFPADMINDIFNTYCLFLAKLAISDNAWSKTEAELLEKSLFYSREKANQTEDQLPNVLLTELFFASVEKAPEQVAIAGPDYQFTYGELAKLVNSYASILQKLGARPNELIAVVMEKGWEQVVAVLAILLSGSAYLPVNPEHPKERIDYLLKTGGVKIAVTQGKWLNEVNWPVNIEIISIEKDVKPEYGQKQFSSTNKPEDLAYVIFTSGSTGLPKGVMIDHRGAVNTILDINKRFSITSQDKVLALSSLSFDLSVYDIFGTLDAGGTIVFPPAGSSREPSLWAEIIEKEHVTIWNSVPTLMKMFTSYFNGKENSWPVSLKTVLLSGDWVSPSLAEDIKRFNPEIKLISLGGATEASIWSIFYPVDQISENQRSIPYGKPLANQKFYILNKELKHCPDYVTGQIFIGGTGLAKGYWNDQEKTANSFIINPPTGERIYRTGDLGRYLPDGNIEFLGREDTQVKIQGHRIELGEIEASLLQNIDIKDAVVLAHGKDRDEKYLAAYVIFNSEPLKDQEIIAFLEKKLPCYMVPTVFIKLKSIPLNSNGKLDRQALMSINTHSLSDETLLMNGEFSEKIAAMVREILDISVVDNNADLLTLGANSIDIVKLANLLEQEFGFCPKVGDIFRLKTINKLASFYEENKNRIQHKSNGEVKTSILLTPRERENFKNSRVSLRNIMVNQVELEHEQPDQELFSLYRNNREFLPDTLTKKQFGNLLSCLRQLKTENGYKFQYPSAGGLYPVQIYLYIKDGGIENLNEGFYYYHPEKNKLLLLNDNIKLDRSIHFYINYPVADQAKFSIFLVGDLKAIEPVYGNSSSEYCLLEAGAITQLLRMNAAQNKIGLCSIGQIDFDKVRLAADFDEKYILLHTILGGGLANQTENTGWSFLENKQIDDSEEWEEITI